MIRFILSTFLLLPILLAHGQAISIDKLETTLQTRIKNIDSLNGKIDKLQTAVAALNKKVSGLSNTDQNNSNTSNNIRSNSSGTNASDIGYGWWLVFSPLILFALVILIALNSGFRFNFQDALTDLTFPRKTIKNPEYNIASINLIGSSVQNVSSIFPPTIEVSAAWPSLFDLFTLQQSKLKEVEAAKVKLSHANNEFEEAKSDAKQAAYDLQVSPEDPAKQQANLDASSRLKTMEGVQNNLEDALKLIQDEASAWKSFFEQTTENKSRNNLLLYAKPSVSSYIALITLLLIVIFVLSICCSFIYNYLRTGSPPSFKLLILVVTALLLGIAPYITNRLSKIVNN